ncbi:hypothetical protein M514_00035 [Trichuris suis]|uniref:Uncharacterized protein n=1 Tax=Trichuris suis TaxID=68888 RepID=A0A085NTU9_9BILA|nr:hypothetical protein M513_00035 [Trichuris suis]KFD72895.1 hypothetical protein M514_00035 [Trichuris suis]
MKIMLTIHDKSHYMCAKHGNVKILKSETRLISSVPISCDQPLHYKVNVHCKLGWIVCSESFYPADIGKNTNRTAFVTYAAYAFAHGGKRNLFLMLLIIEVSDKCRHFIVC